MVEECSLYDANGLGRPSAIVTALTWMVQDYQVEEEWPDMERPPSASAHRPHAVRRVLLPQRARAAGT